MQTQQYPPVDSAPPDSATITAPPQKTKQKTIMEEEIKQGETSSAPAVGQPEVSEAPAQEVSEQKKSERPIRKNGRNRSGMRSSAKKVAVEAESCGEVEDLGNFKEN